MGKLGLAIFFLISSFQLNANIKIPKFNSLKKLQGTIFKIEKKIFKITGDLENLEKKLENKNKIFLENLDKKRTIEEKFAEYKTIIKNEKEQLQIKINRASASFRYVLLNDVDKNDYPKNILGRKVLKNILSKDLELFNQSKMRLVALDQELINLEKKFHEHIKIENQLIDLMARLEKDKQDLSQNYYKEKAKKEKWELKFSKLKTKLIVGKQQIKRKTIREKFASPLEEFQDLSYNKKGITFRYNGVNQVLATRPGKIVYSGKLSTYGNVVMIDHGKSTRSVILGKYEIKIKKGDKVEKGDVLGYTASAENGKLYFEVRKKDKAQNTILFMDGKFISKNTKNKKRYKEVL